MCDETTLDAGLTEVTKELLSTPRGWPVGLSESMRLKGGLQLKEGRMIGTAVAATWGPSVMSFNSRMYHRMRLRQRLIDHARHEFGGQQCGTCVRNDGQIMVCRYICINEREMSQGAVNSRWQTVPMDEFILKTHNSVVSTIVCAQRKWMAAGCGPQIDLGMVRSNGNGSCKQR